MSFKYVAGDRSPIKDSDLGNFNGPGDVPATSSGCGPVAKYVEICLGLGRSRQIFAKI